MTLDRATLITLAAAGSAAVLAGAFVARAASNAAAEMRGTCWSGIGGSAVGTNADEARQPAGRRRRVRLRRAAQRGRCAATAASMAGADRSLLHGAGVSRASVSCWCSTRRAMAVTSAEEGWRLLPLRRVFCARVLGLPKLSKA